MSINKEGKDYQRAILEAWNLNDCEAVLKLLSLNPEDKGSVPHYLEWYLNEHGAPAANWREEYEHWRRQERAHTFLPGF